MWAQAHLMSQGVCSRWWDVRAKELRPLQHICYWRTSLLCETEPCWVNAVGG